MVPDIPGRSSHGLEPVTLAHLRGTEEPAPHPNFHITVNSPPQFENNLTDEIKTFLSENYLSESPFAGKLQV